MTGSNFMVGNGYLEYRGTFEEWEQDYYVACSERFASYDNLHLLPLKYRFYELPSAIYIAACSVDLPPITRNTTSRSGNPCRAVTTGRS